MSRRSTSSRWIWDLMERLSSTAGSVLGGSTAGSGSGSGSGGGLPCLSDWGAGDCAGSRAASAGGVFGAASSATGDVSVWGDVIGVEGRTVAGLARAWR